MLLKYMPSGVSGMRERREAGTPSLRRATRRGWGRSQGLFVGSGSYSDGDLRETVIFENAAGNLSIILWIKFGKFNYKDEDIRDNPQKLTM